MSIPKIIHQIWIGPKPEPSIWTNTFKIDYIKQNPDYEYRLWTDNDIEMLFDGYPVFKMVYDLEVTLNGKSDLMRYLILYKNGGIYIDADSVWLNNKSLDDLIANCDTGLFAAKDPTADYVTGGVIGSTKGHHIFLDLINHIEQYLLGCNNKVKAKRYIRMRSTKGVCTCIGPYLFDSYVKKYNITIYPSYYFYPISWHGVNDIEYYKNNKIREDCYMMQMGLTTNNLIDKL